jgi:hypothetical protein
MRGPEDVQEVPPAADRGDVGSRMRGQGAGDGDGAFAVPGPVVEPAGHHTAITGVDRNTSSLVGLRLTMLTIVSGGLPSSGW